MMGRIRGPLRQTEYLITLRRHNPEAISNPPKRDWIPAHVRVRVHFCTWVRTFGHR